MAEQTLQQLLDRAKIVHANMNEAVDELFQIQEAIRRMNDFDETSAPLIVVEHLTIVGYQWTDGQGGRHGDIATLYKDASIPTYIARGLLQSARERLERDVMRQTIFADCRCDEEADDGDQEG